MMKVYIEPGFVGYNELLYSLKLFFFNKGVQYTLVEDISQADVIFSGEKNDFPIAAHFYEKIKQGIFEWRNFLKDDIYIRTEKGVIDYFATIFYLVNCLQEYGSTQTDEIGRFQYKNSLQKQFGAVQRNIVQEIFNELATFPVFSRVITKRSAPSKIFLSHDIDTVYGALTQDGFYALNQSRVDVMLKLLMNAVMAKPDWLNMDKIMHIEDEYSFRSTFFWLVNKGKINKRLTNSDYNIRSKKIQQIISNIDSNGWNNNLHKSVSLEPFAIEINKAGFPVTGNRYHYLKMNVPNSFVEIEQAGLKFDASLGFAEHYGFRNNYGQPFQPYNMKKQTAFKFIEIPLHVMDTTFHRYMHTPVLKVSNYIIDFFEKNKYDTLFSVLWHNTYFSNYKFAGYMKAYKNLLTYFYENKMECVTPSQIIAEHQWM